MLLYLYADIFAFCGPGYLDEVTAGHMGPFAVAQGDHLAAALMAVPVMMVAFTPPLPDRLCRGFNLALGGLCTLVNVVNLAGESWAHTFLYGALETVLTVSFAVIARRERRRRPAQGPKTAV